MSAGNQLNIPTPDGRAANTNTGPVGPSALGHAWNQFYWDQVSEVQVGGSGSGIPDANGNPATTVQGSLDWFGSSNLADLLAVTSRAHMVFHYVDSATFTFVPLIPGMRIRVYYTTISAVSTVPQTIAELIARPGTRVARSIPAFGSTSVAAPIRVEALLDLPQVSRQLSPRPVVGGSATFCWGITAVLSGSVPVNTDLIVADETVIGHGSGTAE